eukprot:Selendium_serpulae@DN7352_c0_g1_i1.p1
MFEHSDSEDNGPLVAPDRPDDFDPFPVSETNYYSDLVKLANEAKRFSKEPTDEIGRKQLVDRFRVLKEVGQFPEFKPSDEKSFEDWVDGMARKIKTRQLCLPLLQEAWGAVSAEAVAATICSERAHSYEGLVTRVALELFPKSTYILTVEDALWNPPRASTVHEATFQLKTTAARYLRLCERHQRQVAICNVKVFDALLASLPPVVEEDIRLLEV